MTKLTTVWNTQFPTLFTPDVFKRLDEFFGDMDVNDYQSLFKGHPKGDMYVNKEGNLVVAFTLAGYTKEQLSVEVEGDKLIVSASKCEESDERDVFAKRAFKKVFTDFAHRWNLKNATVSHKDGLLKVVVPPVKQEEVAIKLEIK